MKFLYLMLIALCLQPVAAHAQATTTLEATADFSSALTIDNEVNMALGLVDVAGALPAVGTVEIGTNGTITQSGVFTGAGAGTPGSVQVTVGLDGQVVEVSCDATATLSDGAGSTIDMTSIKVLAEGVGATGNFAASGVLCSGLGTPVTSFTLDTAGGTADTFTLGGQINGATAAGFVNGPHSTANVGGDNIDVEIVHQ